MTVVMKLNEKKGFTRVTFTFTFTLNCHLGKTTFRRGPPGEAEEQDGSQDARNQYLLQPDLRLTYCVCAR